jgi:2-keto-4-pentenoate hydratase/2-oxohepta-3-ene-1,7-dioic acid hydratase in catechol pathway
MRCSSGAIAAIFLAVLTAWTSAQEKPEPYKLGMFRQGTRTFAGMVVRDTLVIDLSRAGVKAPATIHEVIASWDQATSDRFAKLAAEARQKAPAYALQLSQVRILPPLTEPRSMLMAARNYDEHAQEMAQVGRTAGTTSVIDAKVLAGIPGLWTRQATDRRGNPYLFPKLSSSISADGDAIVLPAGRTHIDYECELGVVIGRTARHVSEGQAMSHVFGYIAMTDVSDREDRADGRYGSDWLISKSHDTFGPIGPFIVPAAFVGDPHALNLKYTLNGNVMQDDSTASMTHKVPELIAYASRIATLVPGDIIGTGTPGGVGEGRTPPVYLKPGDTGVCAIEKVGALTNPVRAQQPAR